MPACDQKRKRGSDEDEDSEAEDDDDEDLAVEADEDLGIDRSNIISGRRARKPIKYADPSSGEDSDY